MLCVWLPLDGDLHNQGLCNITVTNNGATINNNGKIGKCYSFDGTDDKITLSNLPQPQNISVAMWFKRNANTGTRQFLFTAWGGITLELATDGKITCSVMSNGSQVGYCSPSSPIITTSTGWTHIVFTFQNGIGTKLYINGQLLTATTLTTPIQWQTTTGNIGYFSTYFNGCINDFRIYDHCLSAKEVEEIAKGLVLHYKLNNNGFGGENLLANSKLDGSYTYPTSSYKDYYSPITTSIPDGDIYTLSFEAKSTVSGDKMRTHYYNPNTTTTCVSSQGITRTASDGNMDFTLSTSWTKYWVTYTQTATTAVKHIICPRLVSGQGTGTVSVRNVKLEKGPVATSWSPAKSDALYSILNVGNTVYDSSGYNNNGTIVGSLEAITPSPRYSCATHFLNSNTSIKIGNLATHIPEGIFTFNIWFRKNTGEWSSKNWETILGGPSGFELEAKLGSSNVFYIHPYSWGGGSTSTPNSYSIAYELDKWNMLTMVRTSSNSKFYLNGELKVTGTAGSLPSGNYFLGAWSTETGQNYRGYLCDARIYATALTEAQIKELYNTSMAIDNQGNIHARELVEI